MKREKESWKQFESSFSLLLGSLIEHLTEKELERKESFGGRKWDTEGDNTSKYYYAQILERRLEYEKSSF